MTSSLRAFARLTASLLPRLPNPFTSTRALYRSHYTARALGALFLVSGLGAAQQQDSASLTPLDRRVDMLTPSSPSASQLDAVAALRDQLDGSLLESYDLASGVTRSLFNPVGKLSAPNTGDASDIAFAFAADNLELLGLFPGDLDELEICDSVYSARTGATHVYFCQSHQGLPVINAQLHVNVSSDGSIISVNNSLIPDLAQQQAVPVASIVDLDACTAVANHLGVPLGADGTVSTSDLSTAPITAELKWLPIGRELQLVWRFPVHTVDGDHVYDFTVAASGDSDPHAEERVLTRQDRVSPGLYQVFPNPVESPSHATPASPEDGRLFVDAPEDPIASPLGWHDNGTTAFTIMRGNNAHAYDDVLGVDTPPTTEPDCGSGLNCNFPLDLNQSPDVYTSASVANLFYWTNLIHDVQYQYGFDEAAGNFQFDNFGKGGLGGDDVRAEAQDGSGANNANFTTTPDGQRPKIQMFLWGLTFPARDGDLDNGIIVHEYGHGISTRLVGGPSNVGCLNNFQQPGEGLSDFWALVYTAAASHTGTDPRGIGSYVFGEPTDGGGIRTQRYSTDPAVNNHTYASIAGMAIPHGIGEVWAQAAWEVYWALVDTYGFSPDLHDSQGGFGNQRMMLYVNEGLKNTGCSPAFTDVRDGIIQAAVDNYGGEDVCRVWDAFAAFGLGSDAISGGPNGLTPTNGFQVPPACLVGPRIVSPAQGTTLPGDSATFEWITDGELVTEWMLDLGSIPGGIDIYQSGSLPAATLSHLVTDLPRNGRQMFARLHYQIDGVWSHRNYTYDTVLVAPKITTPAPGSTLTGGSVIFEWIPEGVDVEAWTLWVGSNPGQSNFFQSTNLAPDVLSVEATGLPTDSRTLHVRLLYLDAGDWHPLDYTYTAALIVPTLVSPTPQSVLTGSDVDFSWSSNGAPVTRWTFQIGASPGQSTYFYSGSLDEGVTSVTVSGLPTDSRVFHARLRYLAAGEWGDLDFVFTAAQLVPELLSPSPTVALSGSDVEFTWTDNGASVTRWVLQIGTSPGQFNIFYSGALDAGVMAATATGLPTNSQPMHVRLRFLASGTWGEADYIYTAADLVPALASPSPGAVLAGSSADFTWSANGGAVTQWIFQIGSSLGQNNLFYSGPLAGTVNAVTATGLPTDSRPLYARLRFQWNGVWEHIDYTYEAADLVPSVVSPTPGSQLQSSNANFTWSTNGATISQWIFQIGTSPGSNNLYYSGALTPDVLSANVNNLPSDASAVYARLRYLDGTGWNEANVAYTAASPGPTITNPPPGSQLESDTVAFTWAANGDVVDSWQLQVGDSPGDPTNIFDSGSLPSATLTATVPGLPKDASPLFVRLSYVVAGNTLSRDLTYTSALAQPKLVTPTPGSVLGEQTLFTWTTDGVDVEGWSLFIGSELGGSDLHDSGPLGVSTTSANVSGLPDDGRQVFVRLNYVVDGTTNFRDDLYTAFLNDSRITAPTPGSTLAGADASFSWTAGSQNVTDWILRVGPSPGSGGYFDSGVLAANLFSATASGLPTDARTIHVQLRYRVSGVWLSKNYQYAAADLVPAITAPAAGTTLTGSEASFTWTANGSVVSNWIFQIGTSLGSNNLYYSGVKSSGVLSADASNLPTDASTFYARLRYLSNGSWTSIDQTYTAADLTPEIVALAPGTTLTSGDASFSWTSNGAAVTGWVFQIGTSLGSNNLYYSGSLSANTFSAAASGLPTDARTLYARLRYLSRGVWRALDYTYTAADLAPSITSPAPGTTLPGTETSFTWSSNGSTVTYWIFQMGTSLGSNNLHYSGVLTSGVVSATASGLPVDGSVVYVRLRYLANGSWKILDTTYTAATSP